ncbi:MAG TPA: AAA family ATPase, partial [Anaerolineales bacterium]|nr:AAA family ATPase [Anaerolineales bacterium]
MADPADRVLNAQRARNDATDLTLRPRRLDEMIGQDRVKANLAILIEAARARGEALEHVLFYGPPGLGKTTLAHILAGEMEVAIRVTSGPAIER